MASQRGAVLVVGAGPGIGASVARRFGGEGHPVGLIARTEDRLARLAGELEAGGLRVAHRAADIQQPDALAGAIEALIGELGPPDALCFSPLPDIGLIKPVTDTTAADLDAALSLNVVGAAAAVQAVLPAMRGRSGSSLLFTTGGGALEPSAERAVSGVVYGAQTVYVRMLAETLVPDGIHVSQLVIVGAVGPGKKHEPDTVAEHLWSAHAERRGTLNALR